MVMNETIDVYGMLEGVELQDIPIDKCVTGKVQARQSGTKVDKDDKLVGAIRITNGIIHPILVKDLKNGKYQVKVGKRRLSAYRILKKEDSRYDKIEAYVTDRDLDDD